MKQKKRREDWPTLFFSNPEEKILEIGCSSYFSPLSLRGSFVRFHSDYMKLKDSMSSGGNTVSVQGVIDTLPFLDRSLDGVMILEPFEQDPEILKKVFSEVKRVIKEDRQLLLFLKNQPFSFLWKSNSLKKILNVLNTCGFYYHEIFWPYRNLAKVKRLIPLNSPPVERYMMRYLTIQHSEGTLLTSLKYLGMMILSTLNIFRRIVPRGYLILTHT